ncbi:MAG: uracil-DNA glycosylase [Clostridia bacterium]|nr:phage polymerase-related protein [Clostridiales bacterium]MDK2984788.1 uracil-DNA glycosylase [Clostridia bacterium]
MEFSKPTAEELLQELKEYCLKCNKCPLREGCKQVVFGEGNPEADIMLIGEGPGAREDELGMPFVGAAGQLLDKILAAIDLKREEVYIANVVKCRPPGNRVPTRKEAAVCKPYLEAQVAIIQPKIVVCMGASAARYFLDYQGGITSIRGRWIEKDGLMVMPTFHPAALLRDASKKKPAWLDFQKVQERFLKLQNNG